MEHSARNFSVHELRCRCEVCRGDVAHTIDAAYITKLQAIRNEYGKGMTLSSAFRCDDHPREASKGSPGAHNRCAFDVKVTNGGDAHTLMILAIKHGAMGIGFNLKGERNQRFIHIDFDPKRAVPVVWSY